MGGIYLQVYGLPVDSLVAACHSGRFILDLAFDVGEVAEPPVGNVVKLSPFRGSGKARGAVRTRSGLVVGFVIRNIDKLQDQGPPGDDAASTRQEVSADNVFKHRRLSS